MLKSLLGYQENLKEKLQKHKEVNWSAVTRMALEEHLKRIEMVWAIAQKSKLTQKDADEIARKVNSSVAKRLGLKD